MKERACKNRNVHCTGRGGRAGSQGRFGTIAVCLQAAQGGAPAIFKTNWVIGVPTL
jgi:hypothetical protein